MKSIKTIFSFCVLFFLVTVIVAQNNINSYKYVIVPTQYEFQKTADKYQINSLTKFLLERAGFKAFLSDETIPEDLAQNPCLGLKAKLVNKPSLLSTKMKVELLNCKNEIVFKTKLAKTKEKEYKKAYHEVIRKAFVDIEALNYKYNGKGQNAKDLLRVDRGPIKESEKIEDATTKISKKQKVAKTVRKNPNRDLTRIDRGPITKEEKLYISTKKLEASYQFTNWGVSKIVKSGTNYQAIGGTENFNFATLYPTSKSNLYIIKYVAFKAPKLVELLPNGNLKIDGKPIIKRID